MSDSTAADRTTRGRDLDTQAEIDTSLLTTLNELQCGHDSDGRRWATRRSLFAVGQKAQLRNEPRPVIDEELSTHVTLAIIAPSEGLRPVRRGVPHLWASGAQRKKGRTVDFALSLHASFTRHGCQPPHWVKNIQRL